MIRKLSEIGEQSINAARNLGEEYLGLSAEELEKIRHRRHQPKYIDDRFDYILFTDEPKEKHIGVWEVRKVDYSNSDKTRIARYIKTHPHTLLPQYKATVWLDANLEIISIIFSNPF